MPTLVVRDQVRNPDSIAKMGSSRVPSVPRIGLLQGIDDSDDALSAAEEQPEISPPADIAGQNFDGLGLVMRAPRENGEAGILGGDLRLGHVAARGEKNSSLFEERTRRRGDTETRGRARFSRRPASPSPRVVSHPFGCVTTAFLIRTGVVGRSLAPRGTAAILSATSIPETTSPKAEYWLSKKFESFTTMKNCDEA